MTSREPTDADLRALFEAFYARPDHLAHIPVAKPDEHWWPEMREALKRVWYKVQERLGE